MSRLRLIAEIVGAVLLLSGGVAAGSVAASSATSPTIHGCANNKTGALQVLLKSGAKCGHGTTALSWNRAGSVFGSKTNAATAGSSTGAECTLGEALLMPGKIYGANTIPANGQLVSISSNEPLFALYGTKYGGNGTTTFGIPNLKSAAPNGLTYVICVSNAVYP